MKETLKKLRNQNRYSQDLLAKILGISRLSYLKYESGEVEPPVEIIRKLSKIYKVPYKTLIDNDFKSDQNFDSFGKNLSQSYGFEVSSTVPSYGHSVLAENEGFSSNIISYFSETLTMLQNIIKNLQDQLNHFKSSETELNITQFNKSASFNRNDFFSEIGEIQMDSSYIDELRGASLI